jgi:hypothetical protein
MASGRNVVADVAAISRTAGLSCGSTTCRDMRANLAERKTCQAKSHIEVLPDVQRNGGQ